MTDIELVIKIPEEKLSLIKNKRYCGLYDSDLYKAIANGTPLPKGHGDLIDVNRANVIARETKTAEDERIIRKFLNTLLPIIEADKAESEDKE